MHFKKLTLVFLISALLAGCSKDVLRESISYEIIEEGHLSYAEEVKIPEQALVFKDQADWQNFLPEIERVNPHRAEHFRNPDFDFNHNNLVLIIGEFFNYCCSRITVNGIYRENESIQVEYSETGPGGATALSQAYMLLTIPKEAAG